ncbi:hypothetical protein Aph02nite_22250 [Actinoplanes philippinensis]|nr:hypothetical protein Aph02nite_22250 [Actinoplanes philippinensis]
MMTTSTSTGCDMSTSLAAINAMPSVPGQLPRRRRKRQAAGGRRIKPPRGYGYPNPIQKDHRPALSDPHAEALTSGAGGG